MAKGKEKETEKKRKVNKPNKKNEKANILEKRWVTIKKRSGWCGLCVGVIRDYTGHASRRPNCKKKPNSRGLTLEELDSLYKEVMEEATSQGV